MAFPPSVEAPLGESVRDYWLDRVRQHTHDSYAGIPLSKFPEDLRVYEHLLWDSRPQSGDARSVSSTAPARCRSGTACERCTPTGASRPIGVIGIDVQNRGARDNLDRATAHESDSIGLWRGTSWIPALPGRVRSLVPGGAPCLMVEDSLHTYDTTAAALAASPLVPPGGWFVVEGRCVDVEEMRLPDRLASRCAAGDEMAARPGGKGFRVRRDLEL